MHSEDHSVGSSNNGHSVASLSSARLSGRESETSRDVKGSVIYMDLLFVYIIYL